MIRPRGTSRLPHGPKRRGRSSWKPPTLPSRMSRNFSTGSAQLNAHYRAGRMHVSVPDGLRDSARSLEALIEQYLPASQAALAAAARGLFFSLPVAFDPAESVGPYLAIADRDAGGQPYRFLDMGALIATQAFGENDPALVRSHSRVAAIRDVALRALGIPDRPLPASQGRADADRAGRHAASLRRQHRRRGGRECHQGRADESRHDLGRRRGRFHRLVRGRVPRPDAGRPRRHAPQESAAGLSDLRLAAHSFSGRGGRIAQGNGASRGAQPQAVVGSVGVRPLAARREEQGYLSPRDGRARRVPGAAGPGRRRVRAGPARELEPGRRSAVATGGRRADRADSGRGRCASRERALHAQAAPADPNLRRAAGLRRSADRMGHDRPPVGPRAASTCRARPTW